MRQALLNLLDSLKWYWTVVLLLLLWWSIIPLYVWTRTLWPRPAKWLVTVLVGVIAMVVAAQGPPHNQRGEVAVVTRVIDGATIAVRFPDGRTDRVRYIGVESWYHGSESHEGHSLEANRNLVQGKRVRLVREGSDRDRRGRLRRYAYVGDGYGRFVNLALVAEGHARAEVAKPGSARDRRLVAADLRAKLDGKGCHLELAMAPSPGKFVADKRTGKLHNPAHPVCAEYVSLLRREEMRFFSTEAEANSRGFFACLQCCGVHE